MWTGRQALSRGLTDHMGGLWHALDLAANMSCYHFQGKFDINFDGNSTATKVKTSKNRKFMYNLQWVTFYKSTLSILIFEIDYNVVVSYAIS